MRSSSSSDRGGRWVVAQFGLMLVVLVLSVVPGDWPGWVRLIGFVMLGTGLLGGFWAVLTLGPSLTPYPRPPSEGVLVETGPYRAVRHPIYLAGSLLFLGAALAASIAATIGALLLPVLWHFKAGVEEQHLVERFPGYADYRRRVLRGI